MIAQTQWRGEPAWKFRNRDAEITVPSGYGPRVLSLCAKVGSSNLLYLLENEGASSQTQPEFRFRGGHRLWHAPEDAVRTYVPDNAAPAVRRLRAREALEFTCAPEPGTGIQKILRIEVLGRAFRLTHQLRNCGAWPVELAVWPLTMLRAGGLGVVPLPPKGTHPRDLLPTYSLVPWSYTDLSLPSWGIRSEYIAVDTARASVPQKLGLTAYPGWSAYWLDGLTFVKHAAVVAGARYPDCGCVFETFSNRDLIELETLSPLQTVAPGASAELVETWGLIAGLPKPDTDAAFSEGFRPKIEAWLRAALG